MDDLYRMGLADAAVKVALARIWPMARADEIADAAGVTPTEFRIALKRARGVKTSPVPEPPKRSSRSKKPQGPPGTKYCTRCRRHVPHEDFGKNAHRPDGLSDFCHECWRAYWRERRKTKRAS